MGTVPKDAPRGAAEEVAVAAVVVLPALGVRVLGLREVLNGARDDVGQAVEGA